MKTLIILHGWQSSKERWQKVKEEIEKEGIKVIVPDIPGFKPETELKEPWDLDNYIDWFYSIISSQKLDEGFFLLGHSFGGRMAIKIAAKNLFNLKGVILVSAAGIKKKPTFGRKILSVGATIVKISGIREAPVLKQIYYFLRTFFYRYILNKTDYIDAKGFLNDTIKNILDEDLTTSLDKITVPTMIVWGKLDKITPLEDAYLMKEKIKKSKIALMENIGHDPHIENPKKLAEIISNFIK